MSRRTTSILLLDREFEALRAYIEEQCGIALDGDKRYLLTNRLGHLVREQGCRSFTDFHEAARRDGTGRLRDAIIDAMTTNETLWFRGGTPFTLLTDHFLPHWQQDGANRTRPFRIWSAACSTGQEPYSVAMCLLEYIRTHPGLRPEQFEILATDISPAALASARAGAYDTCAMMRGLPAEHRDRYFTAEGDRWTLCAEARGLVRFETHNLQHSFGHLGIFDLVLCRNVLIYFSDSFKQDVLERLSRLLRPDGALLLGCSESLFNLTDRFELVSEGGQHYYRLARRA